MDVAALRSKVTFQKNETVTDKYGNHKNLPRSAVKVWPVPKRTK